jgi:hexosaminidase
MVSSSMFSTGGDELNTNCYLQDNETQADLMSSGRTLDQALSDFLLAEHAGLRKLGKTPVVKAGR